MHPSTAPPGFTVVETLIAIVVLSVGLLGLLATAAFVTRLIARGQRSAVAATFTAQRLEHLRITGCANQAAGADTLRRGEAIAAVSLWQFEPRGTEGWSVRVLTTYRLTAGAQRTDTIETAFACEP